MRVKKYPEQIFVIVRICVRGYNRLIRKGGAAMTREEIVVRLTALINRMELRELRWLLKVAEKLRPGI